VIRLENISKRYKLSDGKIHTVFTALNFEIHPGEKVGVLGQNGAGKSTLIRLISGAEFPTSGIVNRNMSVSWPLAFDAGFQGSLTGIDNIRFICRVYLGNIEKVITFVKEFSELGKFIYEPVKTYSSGMRARLAFAISMAIEFDCFLIDEVMAVGDVRFHDKCNYELFEKRKDRAMIIVSHDVHNIKAHCDRASVLIGGVLKNFSTVDQAYEFYIGIESNASTSEI
jgi:capsular polysaccharide transport system ATP-binding protein